MVFPIIFYQEILGVKRKLSDIEFLSIKEFGGKLVQNDGTVTTTGDLATLTASSGKDMYLARAKISFRGVNSTRTLNVTLSINGVVEETFTHETTSGNASGQYLFALSGRKATTTQIIKLEVILNDSSDFTIQGDLICFEETTGISPEVV